MAAAANKPGPVHYALVFFVITTVALGIATYSFQKDAADKGKAHLADVEENSKINKAYRSQFEQNEAVKKLIGSTFDLINDPNNPQNQTTVSWQLENEMQTNAKDVKGLNVIDTLRKMRELLDVVSADRDSKAQKIATLEKEVLALKELYQRQVENYSDKAKASEKDKRDVQVDRDLKVTAKVQEIARLNAEKNTAIIELEQEKESREKERQNLNTQITKLVNIVEKQREKIDDLEKLSFEAPDGLIRRVEHASRKVWINLGSDDYLKERTTFSVYSRENQGVGRGAEDIKGKIEVTKIINGHMAEAKILDEDLYRPIVAEDLIYTPIWSPGLLEKISLIGPINLDDDERSDREQLHQIMAIPGAVIDNEVDDNGDRIPADGKITVQTRFLVIGEIPDLANASTDAEKDRIKKINAHLLQMREEARMNGVRIIKLNDFLAYIGYQSKRRTFLPGQQRPFNLKSGAGSAVPSGGSIDRTSTGNVSRLFDKSKRQAPQDKSSGATSGAFGGNR